MDLKGYIFYKVQRSISSCAIYRIKQRSQLTNYHALFSDSSNSTLCVANTLIVNILIICTLLFCSKTEAMDLI
jgi:hypothetical protein